MPNEVSFWIRAKDGTKAGITSVLHNISHLSQVMRNAAAGIRAVWGRVVGFIQGAAQRELAANPFERFVGGAQQALKHVKELEKIGNTGVVPTDQLIEASRTLMNMSSGAIGSARDMKALADVSAVTGSSIGSISSAVGQFMTMAKMGLSPVRSIRSLQMLGVVSEEGAQKLRVLASSGAPLSEMYRTLTHEVNKFAGGVEDDAGKAGNRIVAMGATFKSVMSDAAEPFLEFIADAIGKLIEALQRLKDDGTLIRWADNAAKAVGWVSDAVRTAVRWYEKLEEGAAWYAGFVRGGIGEANERKEIVVRNREMNERRAETLRKYQEDRRKAGETKLEVGMDPDSPVIKAQLDAADAQKKASEDMKKAAADQAESAKKELAAAEKTLAAQTLSAEALARNKRREELATTIRSRATDLADRVQQRLTRMADNLADRERTRRPGTWYWTGNIGTQASVGASGFRSTSRSLNTRLTSAEKALDAPELDELAEKYRRASRNPRILAGMERKAKKEEDEEEAFQALLAKGRKGLRSKAISAAMKSQEAREEAQRKQEAAEYNKKRAEQAVIDSAEHLKNIDKAVTEALTGSEGGEG